MIIDEVRIGAACYFDVKLNECIDQRVTCCSQDEFVLSQWTSSNIVPHVWRIQSTRQLATYLTNKHSITARQLEQEPTPD